jgi:hypothetical protein
MGRGVETGSSAENPCTVGSVVSGQSPSVRRETRRSYEATSMAEEEDEGSDGWRFRQRARQFDTRARIGGASSGQWRATRSLAVRTRTGRDAAGDGGAGPTNKGSNASYSVRGGHTDQQLGWDRTLIAWRWLRWVFVWVVHWLETMPGARVWCGERVVVLWRE